MSEMQNLIVTLFHQEMLGPQQGKEKRSKICCQAGRNLNIIIYFYSFDCKIFGLLKTALLFSQLSITTKILDNYWLNIVSLLKDFLPKEGQGDLSNA